VRTHAARASVMRAVAAAVFIGLLYAVLPVGTVDGTASLVALLAGLAALVAVVIVRVRQIGDHHRPDLRAAEVLALVVPLFVAVVAWAYLLLSAADPAAFTEPLDRVGAAYFTLTVLSTVGFGDISPVSDAARLLVSAQIVLNVTLLAAIVRAVVAAGRRGVTPA
jgi:hypothetical protein